MPWVSGERQGDADRRRRSPTSPGPTSPTPCSRTARRSTTSPTRLTWARTATAASASSSSRSSPASTAPASRRSNYAAPAPIPTPTSSTGSRLINAGEPYDTDPLSADIVDELTTHHSSYYIDHSIAPAPILISNGWTDDLFPPDEALRFYNRTRTEHPGAPISPDLQRPRPPARPEQGRSTPPFRSAQTHDWFDYYVKGTGPKPFQGVQTLTQTCPFTAPSGGATGPFDDLATDKPFSAPTWEDLAPGEVRLDSAAAQTIAPAAGDPSIGQAFDPITGGGACATAGGADQSGVATYRLPAAPASGYTLMGAPTVVAKVAAPAPTSQVAARLLDVAPGGDETLVARGVYRPTADRPSRSSSCTRTAGASSPATSPSSSCCRTTPRTTAPPTARGRSPSPTSSCACR